MRYLITGILLFLAVVPTAAANQLSVQFLTCGHGDAALIRTPSGKSIMIDCGPVQFARQRLPNMFKSRGLKILDHLFLTHTHDDHIGGWPILRKISRIGRVWESGFACPSGLYRKILLDCARYHIPIRFPYAGQVIPLEHSLSIRILSPQKILFRHTGADQNNNSLALLLIHKRIRFLFTGDMEKTALASLFRRYPKLRCDIIKVPHHGSKTGYLKGMYQRLRPAVAVISGMYQRVPGVPSPQVKRAIQMAGARMLLTHDGRDIRIISTGTRYRVERGQ